MGQTETSFEVGMLKNGAEMDPRMRAWYSGRPDFMLGAEALPSHPEDDVTTALDKMELALDGRVPDGIPADELSAAVDFLKERTKDNKNNGNGGNGHVVDIDLVMSGLGWIRENADNPMGKLLRSAAIDARKSIREEQRETEEMPVMNPSEEPAPTRLKSKRAQKREEQERQTQERLEKHRSDRKAEEAAFEAWQKQNPYDGPDVDPYSLLETTVTSKGKIVVYEKDGFAEKAELYVRELAKDPKRLQVEFSQSMKEQTFLKDLPILSALVTHAAGKGAEIWKRFSYSTAEEMLEVTPKWLDLFKGFPKEYKELVKFPGISLNNLSAKEKGGKLRVNALLHDYGLRAIYNTMVKIGDEKPEDFLDLAYDMAELAVDSEDETARKTILLALSGVVSSSFFARVAVLDAPIASGIDESQRLKGIDLSMLMENERCMISEDMKQPRKILSRKFATQYNAKPLALTHGVDVRKYGWREKLIEQLAPPLVDAVQAGELPGSLYLKLLEQKQKQDLPENA